MNPCVSTRVAWPAKNIQYPESIRAVLTPAFPDILGPFQLLEVRGGHDVPLFHHLQRPNRFLSRFPGQGVQEFLHGAFTVGRGKELDLSAHEGRLTCMLTVVKGPIAEWFISQIRPRIRASLPVPRG